MAPTITTRSGRYTLESALETEASFLVAVDDTKSLTALLAALWDQRDAIAATAKSHLGLGWRDDCRVLPVDAWVCGAFNACVLVEVRRGSKAIGSSQSSHGSHSRHGSQSHASTPHATSQYVFRVCIPHKLAESQYPGTVDEKMRCEVAAYAWIEEHCAEIRTPELIGFGFASGPRFTHVRYRPWYARVVHCLRKSIHRMLGRPLLTNYKRCHDVVHPSPPGLGYLLLEHISPDTGLPLSATWKQQPMWQQQRAPASNHEHLRRHNLYRSISRIMLSLARLPQPRIGSFRFDPADGTVRLSNRPLTCATVQLEAAGAQRTMPPGQLYDRADVYVADALTLHDSYFMANPHAVRDTKDAHERLAMRALWRTVAHRFARRDPLPTQTRTQIQTQTFIPQLDLAIGNLVVDDDWNVTCLLGLDWMTVQPAAALAVPHWLTGCKLHQIRGAQYDAYDSARRVFLEVMRQQQPTASNAVDMAQVLEDSWQSRAVWFWAALRSTSAWVFLFEDHILPFFAPGTEVAELIGVASFWDTDIDAVVEKKLADEMQYQAELRQLFEHQGKDV